MNAGFPFHISNDALEEYAFRRFPDAKSAPLDEHLLVCATCQLALKEIDEYVHVMKAATCELKRSDANSETLELLGFR